MARRLLFAVAVAAALLPATAHAATPFGVNVEGGEPTSSFLCPGPVPPFGFNSNVPTCTAYSAGVLGTGSGSHLVPDGFGVVTRVDIRMPNATGPMRISVLRSQRAISTTVPNCCSGVGESQAFTPPPNTISSVQVRLPVKSELTVTGVYEYDAIAISALSPQTPIPMAPLPDSQSGGYFPHVQPGQERFESQASLGENLVLLRGIWEPDADRDGLGDETQDSCVGGRRRAAPVAVAAQCPPAPPAAGGGPAPPPATGAPAAPVAAPTLAVEVGTGSARVRRGRARIALTCGGTPCSGTLRLQNRAAGARGRRVTFARASFSLVAGATDTIAARLTAAGRRLLRARRRVRVWVNVAGAATASRRIVLRR